MRKFIRIFRRFFMLAMLGVLVLSLSLSDWFVENHKFMLMVLGIFGPFAASWAFDKVFGFKTIFDENWDLNEPQIQDWLQSTKNK